MTVVDAFGNPYSVATPTYADVAFYSAATGRALVLHPATWSADSKSLSSSGVGPTSSQRYNVRCRAIYSTGLYATFYDNRDLGEPVGTQVANTIDFSLSSGTSTMPHAELSSGDSFSIRWRGAMQPTTASSYTFFLHVADTSDRARLILDQEVLIDFWTVAPSGTETSAVAASLQNGRYYDLEVHYKQTGSSKRTTLRYSSAVNAKKVLQQAALFISVSSAPTCATSPTAASCGAFSLDPAVAACSTTSSFQGNGLSIATVGIAASFRVTVRDEFSNLERDSRVVEFALGSNPGLAFSTSYISASSSFAVSYTPLHDGNSLPLGVWFDAMFAAAFSVSVVKRAITNAIPDTDSGRTTLRHTLINFRRGHLNDDRWGRKDVFNHRQGHLRRIA